MGMSLVLTVFGHWFHPILVQILQSIPQMSTTWWHQRKVSGIHQLEIRNACTQFHGNPFSSCLNITVWTKAVDRPHAIYVSLLAVITHDMEFGYNIFHLAKRASKVQMSAEMAAKPLSLVVQMKWNPVLKIIHFKRSTQFGYVWFNIFINHD